MTRVTDAGIEQGINVIVKWDDMAYAFAKAGSVQQTEFLQSLAKHIKISMPFGSWDSQALAISIEGDWPDHQRFAVVDTLDVLLQFLRGKEQR